MRQTINLRVLALLEAAMLAAISNEAAAQHAVATRREGSWGTRQSDVSMRPAPTVQEQDKDTDYNCCNLFCDSKATPGCNATHPPPAGWRQRFPGGLKGRPDTVPADNVTACIKICTSLYYTDGCKAAAWNGPLRQCFLKSGKADPVHRPGDTSFVLGTGGAPGRGGGGGAATRNNLGRCELLPGQDLWCHKDGVATWCEDYRQAPSADAPGCCALCTAEAPPLGNCTAWSWNHERALCYLKARRPTGAMAAAPPRVALSYSPPFVAPRASRGAGRGAVRRCGARPLRRQAGLGGANGDARPSNDTSGRMAPAPLARGAWFTALAVGASWALALGLCWSRPSEGPRPRHRHTENPQGGRQRVVPG
jgi:hypothetical protein